MAKTRTRYDLTFSVRRLTELLTEAGFEIRPSSAIRGGLIQFASTPAEKKIEVEWSSGPGMPWERVSGKAERRGTRETETIGQGQYL